MLEIIAEIEGRKFVIDSREKIQALDRFMRCYFDLQRMMKTADDTAETDEKVPTLPVPLKGRQATLKEYIFLALKEKSPLSALEIFEAVVKMGWRQKIKGEGLPKSAKGVVRATLSKYDIFCHDEYRGWTLKEQTEQTEQSGREA